MERETEQKMTEEQQIKEMAKIIAKNVYAIDEPNIDFMPNAKNASKELFNEGYRKQSEGEWIYKFTLDGDKFFECSVCGRQEVVNCLCKERNLAEDRPYCHCGAKMKGGAE